MFAARSKTYSTILADRSTRRIRDREWRIGHRPAEDKTINKLHLIVVIGLMIVIGFVAARLWQLRTEWEKSLHQNNDVHGDAISQEMPAPTSAPSETMKPTEETRGQMGDMEARQQSVPQTENAPVLAAIGLGKIQTVDTRGVGPDSSLAFSPEGQPAISYEANGDLRYALLPSGLHTDQQASTEASIGGSKPHACSYDRPPVPGRGIRGKPDPHPA